MERKRDGKVKMATGKKRTKKRNKKESRGKKKQRREKYRVKATREKKIEIFTSICCRKTDTSLKEHRENKRLRRR